MTKRFAQACAGAGPARRLARRATPAVVAASLALALVAHAARADDPWPAPIATANSASTAAAPEAGSSLNQPQTLIQFSSTTPASATDVRAASYQEAAAPQGPPSRPPTSAGDQRDRILPPPSAGPTHGFLSQATGRPSSNGAMGARSILTPIAGLGIVVGAFLIFAWVVKRSLPKSASPLPGEVVEVLGRAPLAARQVAHLMRVGNKLILVAVSNAGVETLTEITDPVEVDRLAGICGQSRPGSASQTFRGVLESLADHDRTSRRGRAG